MYIIRIDQTYDWEETIVGIRELGNAKFIWDCPAGAETEGARKVCNWDRLSWGSATTH